MLQQLFKAQQEEQARPAAMSDEQLEIINLKRQLNSLQAKIASFHPEESQNLG